MIIAHRGVHDNKNIIENTLPAFKLAVQKDYAIEFDISITKDKQNTVSNDFKEKTEYKIPEIKYETVDLFENFRKMNENYCFPGSFYKFHGV